MEWIAENRLWVAGGLLTLLLVYWFTRPGRSGEKKRGGRTKTTPGVIDAYFRRYGWTYSRAAPDVWLTGWRTGVSSFRMFVRLTRHWIYFTISPFVTGHQGPGHGERFYHYLLRLSRDIDMAKFCIDSDGDVVLTVELPCANLDYEEFADAIKALCHIADETYVELSRLAQDRNAPSRYDEYGFVR
jgi:hypothetical protein